MKRVSRGREEADAEHYRAPSSLMERPRRECHHLARAGQCGLPRRHLRLQRQVRVHRFQVHRRRLSNDGLASERHRFGRVVPQQRHYHHCCQQQQQQQQRYQTHIKKDRSSIERIEEPGDQLARLVSVSSVVGSRRGRSWRRRRRWSSIGSVRIRGGISVTWRRQRRVAQVEQQQVILN